MRLGDATDGRARLRAWSSAPEVRGPDLVVHRQRRLVQLWEDNLPRRAAGVTVNTHFLLRRCRALGVPAARIAYVPNGIAPDQIAAMAEDNGVAREELNQTIQEVRATLEGIESALSRHEGALQGQVSELTAARDAAERMLRRLTAFGADFVTTSNGSTV